MLGGTTLCWSVAPLTPTATKHSCIKKECQSHSEQKVSEIDTAFKAKTTENTQSDIMGIIKVLWAFRNNDIIDM